MDFQLEAGGSHGEGRPIGDEGVRADFLFALGKLGVVAAAAAAAKIDPTALYNRRFRDKQFARDWDATLRAARETLRGVL